MSRTPRGQESEHKDELDALWWAENGDVERMEELQKKRAMTEDAFIKWINALREDVSGWTCLHLAAILPKGLPMLQWLYAHHAETHNVSKKHRVFASREVPAGSTHLHAAVAARLLETAKFILLNSDQAFIDIRNADGITAKEFIFTCRMHLSTRAAFLAAFTARTEELAKKPSGKPTGEQQQVEKAGGEAPQAKGSDVNRPVGTHEQKEDGKIVDIPLQTNLVTATGVPIRKINVQFVSAMDKERCLFNAIATAFGHTSEYTGHGDIEWAAAKIKEGLMAATTIERLAELELDAEAIEQSGGSIDRHQKDRVKALQDAYLECERFKDRTVGGTLEMRLFANAYAGRICFLVFDDKGLAGGSEEVCDPAIYTSFGAIRDFEITEGRTGAIKDIAIAKKAS